ncbi:baseplate protein (plasmid) [Leclercia adecarboxylata]|nr:baseplate protein [Leclercia adecarboxylata]
MRAQIRLLPEWNSVPEENLPWAEYMLGIGNAFTPTKTGDLVWVEFPYTDARGKPDTRRPLIVGAAQDAPGGVPNVAPEASGQGEPWTPGEVDGAPARPKIVSTEDFVVHRNNILEVRTAGGGYEIANTAAGARVGINESGEMYLIGPGNLLLNMAGDIIAKAGGKILFESGAEMGMTAGAEMDLQAGGALTGKAASVSFSK